MASARLAKNGPQAQALTAFAATSPFNPNEKYLPGTCRVLPAPTADSVPLTKAAQALLPQVYDGVKYVRARILVTDLLPPATRNPWAS
ncbi:hypothetical protein NEK97_12665 [Paenarthrobacter sp. UW852]|uniref:DinB/UmuC family translesion DNA polymerase n=1 Tax=Paenarthrobacter sp. UW852 TaxID=2951989 RepID=UPI002147BA5F|nr:hypothetical protein [Paenarthrobacter sp. UW852]MCR1162315.1 hypothetical protein [Paenarthrobacter sp. UW852]